MSTDFQKARDALGARLRELRTTGPAGRLTGPQLGERLGWPHSKVYKLENGRQTASAADLQAWAEATESPDAAAELQSRLQGLESHVRSWRRQLATG
ncbi:transcriptional regulator, partial [Streptomyces cavourensis]